MHVFQFITWFSINVQDGMKDLSITTIKMSKISHKYFSNCVLVLHSSVGKRSSDDKGITDRMQNPNNTRGHNKPPSRSKICKESKNQQFQIVISSFGIMLY